MKRSHLLRPIESGFHQCWYPVELSKNLGTKPLGIDLCDARIALYRGVDGRPHGVSAHCKHMGADLSLGDVVDDCIRCPFHHWSFAADGRCVAIPSGDKIPKRANLTSFPVEEKWGLIWVFYGSEPLYDVPEFDGFDPERMVVRAFEAKFVEPLRVSPWVFTTNIFDIVHNRVVHGLNIQNPEIVTVDDYRTRFHWTAKYVEKEKGELRSEVFVYATNSIRVQGAHDGRLTWQIAGLSPMGKFGTRAFLSVVTEQGEGAEAHLDREEALHTRFVNEDLPILNSLGVGDDNLVASDRALSRFIRYARKYPTATFGSLEAVGRAVVRLSAGARQPCPS